MFAVTPPLQKHPRRLQPSTSPCPPPRPPALLAPEGSTGLLNDLLLTHSDAKCLLLDVAEQLGCTPSLRESTTVQTWRVAHRHHAARQRLVSSWGRRERLLSRLCVHEWTHTHARVCTPSPRCRAAAWRPRPPRHPEGRSYTINISPTPGESTSDLVKRHFK